MMLTPDQTAAMQEELVDLAERTHYQLLLDLESAQAHYEELKVREKIARQRKMRLNREI